MNIFPLVLGETSRRIGRLDEAPRIYQRKRRGRAGVREPVSVGFLSLGFSILVPAPPSCLSPPSLSSSEGRIGLLTTFSGLQVAIFGG